MGNKTCELLKSGKTVLFAFEEAIGIVCGVLIITINIKYGQTPTYSAYFDCS